jgi:serine protease Do
LFGNFSVIEQLFLMMKRINNVRYAYAITAGLLFIGTAGTLALQGPGFSQQAQNDGAIRATTPPRPGAPMSFADLAERLQPAVVNISTTQRVTMQGRGPNPFAGTPFEDMFQGGGSGRPRTQEGNSLGSGFIISADGYVVTNNHVVSADNQGNGISATVTNVKVILADRKEYNARIVGRDPLSDLALLKIEATNLPFVRFGDSTKARVGDWVMAIGNPFGLGGSVTAGIVSALHRDIGGQYDKYIQTDASINRGNSGGPMFDMNGNVVGINTAIFSPTGGNVGIGFAIPAEQAITVIDQLRGTGSVKRGYLGVNFQPIDEGIAEGLGLDKNSGELITNVESNGPAAKAGIREGDVILKINGATITPDNRLSFIVGGLKAGTRVPIEVLRDGKRVALTVLVGERPSDEVLAQRQGGMRSVPMDGSKQKGTTAQDTLGLAVQALTPDIAQELGYPTTLKGVIIAAVDPESDAGQKGLKRGDVIQSVNRVPANSIEEMNATADAARKAGKGNVVLQVRRQGSPVAVFVAIKFKSS